MNRQQKEVVVSDIKDLFSKAQATFIVNYKGVSVSQIQMLRRGLRDENAVLKVSKARLMKIAIGDAGQSGEFKNDLKDQIGLVFALTEAPSVAKRLVGFAKENDSFDIVSGCFDNGFISLEQVSFLASLPSKDILLAQLLGTLQAPVTNFVRVLQLMIIRLLFVLKQVADQKGE